jgi:6-phosphogluconolactonase (cycloisomerase 2 family)
MSTRFAWLLGVVALVAIGLLVACGTKYSASSDGLVLVSSQGSNVIQIFSFNLGDGHIAGIDNPPGTVATPSSMVIDPAGAYAYAVVTQLTPFQCGSNSSALSGIQSFKVNSSGSLAVSTCTPDPNPIALTMDSSGKFLFVAEGLNAAIYTYSISSGSLTQVAGTYTLPTTLQPPNLVALAATPTSFPTSNAVCSTGGAPAPTSEFLYVADHANNLVWEFQVDMSSGALGNPPGFTAVQVFPAHSEPNGVAVDSCNRFVYVDNLLSNNVDAYTICNGSSTQSTNCPQPPAVPDGALTVIDGSPFSLPGGANGPGPILVDPFGNTLYALDTLSSMISIMHISPVSGKLVAASPATAATGADPTAMAIRSDDSWLFVPNFTAATLSQYSITPATGALSPQPSITTDNYPTGVAVK